MGGALVGGGGGDGVACFVPVGVGELVAGVAALDAGAVYEDVDAVALKEDGGDEGGDGGLGGEVGRVDGCFSAEGFDGLFGACFGIVSLYAFNIRQSRPS